MVVRTYCKRCEESFSGSRALERHKRDSPSHNICPTCDPEANADFKTPEGLRQHRVQKHSYDWRCKRDFGSDKKREEHFMTSRDHHYCSLCHKHVESQRGLKSHNRQKHEDLNYSCPMPSCGKAVQAKNSLDAHLRSNAHMEKTIPCPFRSECERKFTSYANVALHLESGRCRSGLTRVAFDEHVTRLECRKHLYFRRCSKRLGGCGRRFPTISAFLQHAESGCCGDRKKMLCISVPAIYAVLSVDGVDDDSES